MKRILKRIFIGLFATIILVAGLLVGGAYIYRDKIEALILTEINKQITEPVTIKGGINFSLVKNFPFASITLYDVSIKNKFHVGPEYLLNVKELSCLFNIQELIHSKIIISRIHIYDGEVNIYRDAKGNGDYDIYNPPPDTSTAKKPSGSLSLNLHKAVAKDIHFTYLTENKEEDIALKIEKMTLGGNFANDSFDLETSENMIIELLRLNGEEYLSEKTFNSNITINVDQKRDLFTLNKADLELAGNRFDVKGYMVSSKKGTYVNFTAGTKGKDISKLIALVPLKFKSSLAGAEGSGGFEVEAKVTGSIRTGVNPDIAVNAILDKTKITIPRIRKPLRNVSLDAYYHMDSLSDDELVIRKFHSEFDGQPQDFNLKLVHLSNPDFVFNADGVADLHDLKSFFTDSIVQSAEGLITFQGFHIEGSKNGITDPNDPKFKASGNFSLKNVAIKAGGVTYGNINGSLDYSDQDITIKGFTMKLVNTDISFDGRVTSIIAYALSRDRSKNTPDVPLGITGTLRMKNFDVGKIIAAYSATPTRAASAPAKQATANSSSPPMDPRDFFNIQGHLNISIDKFSYQKMVFEKLYADLGFSPYRLDINTLRTHTMGGDVIDTGYVAFTPDHQMIFALGLAVDKVDLTTLFQECDNFGQATMTDRNLKGKLSAVMQLYTVWNNYTNIDLDQLTGNLSCSVLHGELNNFGPMKSAAAFIKIDELNHIVFSDLSNQITIKNRIITIPMMEVQSSAINLMMAGTHTLDNVMDYQIKVNLRKLLAAKFGRKENNDAYIEDNPYEGVNLYLTITGDVDHPKIAYDKKSVKKKLKSDLAAQKEELKELFKKDKDKKVKGKDEVKREEKYYDTRKKPEYIDFQDDSAKSN